MQTRTAGFNSVDIGLMYDETWVGMDVLMFIGGGPAGTAGGIKVTTFAVLFFILLTELRGDGAVNVFGKRLSRAVHRQAIAVVLHRDRGGGGRHRRPDVPDGPSPRQEPVRSGVGLRDRRPVHRHHLRPPDAAEVVLVLLMFLGRLGPLTLGTALALRERRILYELPKERPAIG